MPSLTELCWLAADKVDYRCVVFRNEVNDVKTVTRKGLRPICKVKSDLKQAGKGFQR